MRVRLLHAFISSMLAFAYYSIFYNFLPTPLFDPSSPYYSETVDLVGHYLLMPVSLIVIYFFIGRCRKMKAGLKGIAAAIFFGAVAGLTIFYALFFGEQQGTGYVLWAFSTIPLLSALNAIQFLMFSLAGLAMPFARDDGLDCSGISKDRLRLISMVAGAAAVIGGAIYLSYSPPSLLIISTRSVYAVYTVLTASGANLPVIPAVCISVGLLTALSANNRSRALPFLAALSLAFIVTFLTFPLDNSFNYPIADGHSAATGWPMGWAWFTIGGAVSQSYVGPYFQGVSIVDLFIDVGIWTMILFLAIRQLLCPKRL